MAIPNPEGEFDIRDLVTIRKFRDLHEALFAKGCLESAGIESFLADDNMVHMDWLISNLLGGVKLKVDAADVEIANELLSPIVEVEVDDATECRVLPFRKPQTLD